MSETLLLNNLITKNRQINITMIGNIPEKIVYISRPATKINWEWDDFERKHIQTGEEVLPTFVADPSKPKTVETGISWASVCKDDKIIQEILDNKPFHIRILSLEKRNQGGRAYKAILDFKNYYVDLREDVLLDAIIESGISKGGIPNAEFIWGKVGSQMKLVRVDSELHSELIKTTEDGKKSKVSNVEIGGVYKNKKGEFSVYLGQHWILDYDDIKEILSYGFKQVVDHNNYRWIKRQLWFNVPKWLSDRRKSFNVDMVKWESYHSYKWVKNAAVIEKVAQIDPTDWKYHLSLGIKETWEENYAKYNNKTDWMNRLYYARYLSFSPINEEPKLSLDEFLDPVRNRITPIEKSNK